MKNEELRQEVIYEDSHDKPLRGHFTYATMEFGRQNFAIFIKLKKNLNKRMWKVS